MGTFAHTDLVSHPIDGGYRGHGPRDTVGVFWGNYLDASAEPMAQKNSDKSQNMPHSEVVGRQAYKVFEESYLDHNLAENPDVRPDLSAIAPPDWKAKP